MDIMNISFKASGILCVLTSRILGEFLARATKYSANVYR